jgi:hypothetical protein
MDDMKIQLVFLGFFIYGCFSLYKDYQKIPIRHQESPEWQAIEKVRIFKQFFWAVAIFATLLICSFAWKW